MLIHYCLDAVTVYYIKLKKYDAKNIVAKPYIFLYIQVDFVALAHFYNVLNLYVNWKKYAVTMSL